MITDGSSDLHPSTLTTLPALLGLLAEELPAAVELRRHLHETPELGAEEHATVGLIDAALPIEGRPFAGTGRLVSTGPPGPGSIWLRAELDGLAIAERTGASASGRRRPACAPRWPRTSTPTCPGEPSAWSPEPSTPTPTPCTS